MRASSKTSAAVMLAVAFAVAVTPGFAAEPSGVSAEPGSERAAGGERQFTSLQQRVEALGVFKDLNGPSDHNLRQKVEELGTKIILNKALSGQDVQALIGQMKSHDIPLPPSLASIDGKTALLAECRGDAKYVSVVSACVNGQKLPTAAETKPEVSSNMRLFGVAGGMLIGAFGIAGFGYFLLRKKDAASSPPLPAAAPAPVRRNIEL